MDYSSDLLRHASFSCVRLDHSKWCKSFIFSRKGSDNEKYEDDDDQMHYSSRTREVVPRWQGLWRRIVKEKKKILNSSTPVRVPYDEYTYAQNFDEGSAWVEPENLSRSFSAKFAVPSIMLLKRSS